MKQSKTINNYDSFVQEYNIEKNINDKKCLDVFFKKRFLILENSRIRYPTIRDINQKILELDENKQKLIKLKNFWKKELFLAKTYDQKIKYTKFIKKKFWQHKLKQITNKEYSDDVKNARLTDNTLLDPRYERLFDTFLTDYDYRKKLVDTVNKSLIYKESDIGDHSKKKQKLKADNAKNMLDSISEKINQINLEIEANKIILKYLKKQN